MYWSIIAGQGTKLQKGALVCTGNKRNIAAPNESDGGNVGMQMGEALICGFVNAGMCTPDRISVSVRSEERSQRMLSLGVQVRRLPLSSVAEPQHWEAMDLRASLTCVVRLQRQNVLMQ